MKLDLETRGDRSRHLSQNVVQRTTVEQGFHLRLHVGHQDAQRAGEFVRAGAAVAPGRDRSAGQRRERSVERANHLADGDFVGAAGQAVAPAHAAFAGEQAGVAQAEENLLEEFDRDVFLPG